MTYDIYDFVKKASKEKKFSELDVKRFRYDEQDAYCSESNTFEWDAVVLTDLKTKERVNRNGYPYTSRYGTLIFYNDADKMKMRFLFNIWENDVTDEGVRFKPNNPVTNLIKAICKDNENNVFVVDYEGLQKAVEDIKNVQILVKVISNRNDFKIYGFDVINIAV